MLTEKFIIDVFTELVYGEFFICLIAGLTLFMAGYCVKRISDLERLILDNRR